MAYRINPRTGIPYTAYEWNTYGYKVAWSEAEKAGTTPMQLRIAAAGGVGRGGGVAVPAARQAEIAKIDAAIAAGEPVTAATSSLYVPTATPQFNLTAGLAPTASPFQGIIDMFPGMPDTLKRVLQGTPVGVNQNTRITVPPIVFNPVTGEGRYPTGQEVGSMANTAYVPTDPIALALANRGVGGGSTSWSGPASTGGYSPTVARTGALIGGTIINQWKGYIVVQTASGRVVTIKRKARRHHVSHRRSGGMMGGININQILKWKMMKSLIGGLK